ncbi:MAG: beta galactosidase jelly roll domain-containing protein [Bacteroidaceae bacterium]|nr:beta galactosidase jelly roll domain-containing protein [Bacteroidaceae bacterium]
MNKKLYFLVTLLMVVASPSVAAEVPAPQNIYARDIQSLNGTWNYFVDVQEQGYYDYRMNPIKWGYFVNAKPKSPSDLIEYDFDKSPSMQIPSDWNTADEKLFFYEGTVWFRRLFDYHKKEGKRALLYFGAVNYEAIVFVNGKEMGKHVGGFTPFCYDVTDVLHEGENFVVVKVDNKRHADNVPTRIFDWWNYGGITRDVLLVNVEDTYMEDYKLQLTDKTYNSIDFSVQLNKKVAGEKVTLTIPELKVKKTVITDAEGKASLTISKVKPLLWSPETPKLYAVQLQHGSETMNDEIGFRTIETRGKQLLLNGKPIFLRGVCVHEETAYTNRRANCAADADTLIAWAKSMNCNFLRLAHYPHNEHAIREAERQGMLLWAEIPVYWTISWSNPDTYNNAHRQLSDLISRDKNRAAVIIWSIANETPHSDARDNFLSRLATSAKEQDPTRLISMAMEVLSASNYVNRLQDNMNRYVDVISFNQYVGWYRDVNDAKKMKWEIPYDKPVIISEFGGGAKAGLNGTPEQRWTEEFQKRLYQENLDMLDKIDGLSGTCPWVLKDFRSPRRPLPEIQDYFNRKGLFSDQGKRKKAFYVLKEWYEKKKIVPLQ